MSTDKRLDIDGLVIPYELETVKGLLNHVMHVARCQYLGAEIVSEPRHSERAAASNLKAKVRREVELETQRRDDLRKLQRWNSGLPIEAGSPVKKD